MKITYLIGAGASKNALPIVNEIPGRILEIIDKITDTDSKFSVSPLFKNERLPFNKAQALKHLIDDLKWLAEAAKNHASIDTFAKKLFLKDNFKELKKLKAVLSIYFILEQAASPYDKRYDAFIASILDKDIIDFPANIRIVSWNYDYQFELAFSEYTDSKEIMVNQNRLNVVSKFSYRSHKSDRFAIFKINGTTNFLDHNWRNEHEYFEHFESCITEKLLERILENYTTILHTDLKLYCNLSFAWEEPVDGFVNIIDHTINETNDTEVLIVIGYSFPFFNREVDRKIINKMTNLNKVYFQAPDADNIKERFLSIRGNIKAENLVSRINVDQFFLPNEL